MKYASRFFAVGDRVGWSPTWLNRIVADDDKELSSMRGTVVAVLPGSPFVRVRVQWDGNREANSHREECLRLMGN